MKRKKSKNIFSLAFHTVIILAGIVLNIVGKSRLIFTLRYCKDCICAMRNVAKCVGSAPKI